MLHWGSTFNSRSTLRKTFAGGRKGAIADQPRQTFGPQMRDRQRQERGFLTSLRCGAARARPRARMLGCALEIARDGEDR